MTINADAFPKRIIPGVLAAAVILGMAGCNFPDRLSRTLSTPAVSPQEEDLPDPGNLKHTDTAAPPDGGEAVAPDDTPTMTATIAHLAVPGEPGVVTSYVEDYSSKNTAPEKRAPGGDSFTYNLFERPFLSDGMQYMPGVDVVRADLAKDATWFYVTVRLQEAPHPEGLYAVEVDADIDGRGDYLIGTAAPPGTEWTTGGVQIREDANGDVGGPIPLKSDPPGSRDGYDDLAFDQGIGEDPDAAWSRMSPSDPKHVQIAFKRTAIGNDAEFLWGVWADAGVQRPGWLDYNDHFTLTEAGSPLQGNAEYPLKGMAAVDNTCRMSFGFPLTGTEPGACYIAAPTAALTPTRTATATVQFVIFRVLSAEIYDVTKEGLGSCLYRITAYGRATANTAGTATLRWEVSTDDHPYTFGAMADLTFGGAGTIEAGNYGDDFGPTEKVRIRMHILAPFSVYSNVVTEELICSK